MITRDHGLLMIIIDEGNRTWDINLFCTVLLIGKNFLPQSYSMDTGSFCKLFLYWVALETEIIIRPSTHFESYLQTSQSKILIRFS